MTISFALADIEERPSTFETPLGPQWIIDDTEDGRPLLVRRLNQARGLLRVAPVLKLASQIDHPRLHGAGHWWRQEDAIYVATPTPRGEPIAVKSPGRRTWHEALDLWQPVAEALRSAHGRGIMHGRINPWNVWYEPTTDRLTIIDLGCWIGDGTDEDLWCAPEMRHDGIPVPPSLPTDVHGLARLLIYLGLGEDEACRERPNFSGLPPYAIPVLERAIAHDPDLRPRRLDELMAGVHFQSPDEALPFDVTEDTSLLFGRVSAREDLSNTKFGRGVRFFLTDSSSAEGEPIGAFFYEGVDRDIYHSIKWVWDGAELNLLGARRVEDSQGRVFLTSHSETLPVLEPHWPISVTNVLKAERCTSRFLVDERDGGSTSRPLVFGNLVHGLLEDLTTPEPPTFEEAIAARLPDLRLAMLAAGLGDADIPTLVAEARQHFENLQEFTARETGDGDERKGWTGGHVEATRYSSVYGLEGRIDLVTEDARDGLQIIELKSGRPWDGHLSQLRSYTLLWEGVAKRRNLPISGYVLYSKNAQMKIVPMEDVRRERRILRARNELIALHRSFVDPGYEYRAPHFMQIPSNCNASACNFRRDRCKEQTGLLGLAPGTVEVWKGFEPALVRRVRAYHAHFTRLIEMERWAENTAMGAVLQTSRLDERVANHRALADARIHGTDPARSQVSFDVKGAQVFSPGDYLLAHRGELNASHILRGVCVRSEDESVILSSAGAASASSLPRDGWILDRLPSRIGFRTAHQAVYRTIRRQDEMLLRILLEPASSRAQAAMSVSVDDPAELVASTGATLNETQRLAIRAALAAPKGCLIQGPPGTGKTTVIAHLVGELRARGERVLLSALTNTAVDTLLVKLLEAGQADFIRLGSASRSRELACALEERGFEPAHFFSDDLARESSSLDALAERISTCATIATTAHGSVSSPVFEYLERQLGDVPFDVTIVDEASQLTEPMTLGPINLARRFILVGDHRQLPPIVVSDQSLTSSLDTSLLFDDPPDEPENQPQLDLFGMPIEENTGSRAPRLSEDLREMGCAGLDRSLFERLIEFSPHLMLDIQYRMHEDIMAFSSEEFYGGRLLAHESNRRWGLDGLGELLGHESAVVFVDVDVESGGRTNEDEARAIIAALEALGSQLDSTSVGVVTPFRAQAHLIRHMLKNSADLASRDIDVDTVERFQGSERDVIMVSLVKTERAGEFLADPRRLNVTLTRARKKLMIFGNRSCLELNPLFRRLLEQRQTTFISWTKPQL